MSDQHGFFPLDLRQNLRIMNKSMWTLYYKHIGHLFNITTPGAGELQEIWFKDEGF